ncbi:MAG: septum formation initiator family protein [Bacteroidales bacterium]|nr:septum formation initiator family protein [Bacteroidales bacterium]
MEEEKKLKKSFVRCLWIGAVIAGLFLLLKRDNVLRWAQAGFIIRSEKRTIERNRLKIEEMDRRIDALRNNLDTLESYAREKFGFTEPGDEVYILEKGKK